jgi:hypothetical protein
MALAACEMPPDGHVLAAGERELLIAWARCGASGTITAN